MNVFEYVRTTEEKTFLDKWKDRMNWSRSLSCLDPKVDIRTPIILAEEMIHRILSLSKPSIVRSWNWLDPCAGRGTFAYVLIYKLFDYLKDEIVDENERLEHILNHIYLVEINRGLYNNLSRYFKHVYHADFLDYDFKNMKFDVIVGNPPYQKKNKEGNSEKVPTGQLYIEFMKFAHEISEITALVTPQKWLKSPDYFDLRKDVFSKNLFLISKNPSGTFDDAAHIDGGTIFYIRNNTEPMSKLLIKNIEKSIEGDYTLDLRSKLTVNLDFDPKIVESVKEKILKNNSKFMSSLYRNPRNISSNHIKNSDIYKEKKFPNSTKVLFSRGNIRYIDSNMNLAQKLKSKNFKVTFERVYGGYWKKGGRFSRLQVNENCITSQSISFFEFDDIIQANNCMNYINSIIATLLRKIVQTDKNYTANSFSLIPIIDFTRSWADQELYEYFNLTQEEIDYIEANV